MRGSFGKTEAQRPSMTSTVDKKKSMAKKMNTELRHKEYKTLISKTPIKASDMSAERSYHRRAYETRHPEA